MDRHKYDLLIDKVLKDLGDRVDNLELDDVDVVLSDGKLVIEFEDRTTYIINRQGVANQIWLAEPKGGWHFNYQDDKWICDKRGIELKAAIEELISKRLGRDVVL